MDAKAIPIGTKVEFELYNALGARLGGTYKGEFMEITGDMEVILFSAGQAPMPMTFSKEIRVKASFHHKMHGPLHFDAVLLRKEETKTGTKFHIRIDDDFKEVKKREYYRPGCFLKAGYRLEQTSGDISVAEQPKEPYKNAKTKNLSFTGACIVVDEDSAVLEGMLLYLTVWLREDISVGLCCRVTRIMPFEADGKKQSEIGLLIEGMSEKDRELLKRYITSSAMTHSLYWGETPFNL